MAFKVAIALMTIGLTSSFAFNLPPQYHSQEPEYDPREPELHLQESSYQPQESQYQPQESQYQPQYQPEKPQYHAQERSRYEDQHKKPSRPYKFDYGVRDDYTGTNFGHQEHSDGNTITGSYTVALPDGRIQKVTYVADHINGFQAKVTYEGEARYDEPQKQDSPYGAPPQYKPEPQYKPQHQHQYKPQPQYRSEPEPQYTSQTNIERRFTPSQRLFRPSPSIEPRFNIPDKATFEPLDLISMAVYSNDDNIHDQSEV